jgi:hypothetical protein
MGPQREFAYPKVTEVRRTLPDDARRRVGRPSQRELVWASLRLCPEEGLSAEGRTVR